MNHIEKALQLADKYEKKGNKELSNKFFRIAEKYEKILEEMRNVNRLINTLILSTFLILFCGKLLNRELKIKVMIVRIMLS